MGKIKINERWGKISNWSNITDKVFGKIKKLNACKICYGFRDFFYPIVLEIELNQYLASRFCYRGDISDSVVREIEIRYRISYLVISFGYLRHLVVTKINCLYAWKVVDCIQSIGIAQDII